MVVVQKSGGGVCADRGIGKAKSARCMHGWDREAAAWVANRRFLYQQWTQQRRAAETREQREEALVSLHTYDRYTKELHRKLRQRKAAAEKQQWASLESMQKSDVRGFYRKIKQLRGGKPSTLPERMCRSDGSSTTSDEETRQAWADYFAEMGNDKKDARQPDRSDRQRTHCKVHARVARADIDGATPRVPHSSELAGDITSEVELVMKRMSDGRAAGPDGIVNELIIKVPACAMPSSPYSAQCGRR